LAKAVLVLTLDGLKDLKKLRSYDDLDLKVLKILILDEAKFQFLRS